MPEPTIDELSTTLDQLGGLAEILIRDLKAVKRELDQAPTTTELLGMVIGSLLGTAVATLESIKVVTKAAEAIHLRLILDEGRTDALTLRMDAIEATHVDVRNDIHAALTVVKDLDTERRQDISTLADRIAGHES